MVSSIFTFSTALFAALAAASPLRVIDKRESPLQVELAATDKNAVVVAKVTNTGSEELSILKLGSIFSDAPVQKVEVFANEEPVEFLGVRLSYDMSKVTEEDYVKIPAGGSLSSEIELARYYDLSDTESISVVASGVFQTADSASIENARAAPEATVIEFESAPLSIQVDTEAAAKVETLKTALQKRLVTASCSGSRATSLNNALNTVISRANNAATAASSGDANKFNEYFRTTAASTRSNVASRFRAVASAASTSSRVATYYCTDIFGYCGSNVLAWTQPASNVMANCDLFYSALPASTGTCHAQDQWSTVLHEMTHAPGVFSPGTVDNAYGYAASIRLTAARALANADTYSLYANAIALNC